VVTLNKIPAFQANVLRIEFQKEDFDRRKDSPPDPPKYILERAVNSFLTRLRYVAHAPDVRPLELMPKTWNLTYLNDDGSQIENKDGFITLRQEWTLVFTLKFITQQIWDDILSLEPAFEPPAWETLLLDAQNELLKIGPAIVLAATALEVFVSQILDELGAVKKVPKDLWEWINKRESWMLEPSVEEQFDSLLKMLTGHSLIEDLALWEKFKNLKTARNKFVHEGVARIGGKPVDVQTARELVEAAGKIIRKIKGWLPPELHWKEFEHKVDIFIAKKFPSPKKLPSSPPKNDSKSARDEDGEK